MPNNIDAQAVTVSVKIYERLLATYPPGFRREYGSAMKQLFRDQCRDAWSEARGRGLAVLWLRVLPDLAKTSLCEHLSNFNQRESIVMKTVRALRADPRLRATFLRAFALVFIGAIVCSVLVAQWMPRTYSSTVRLEVAKETAHASGTSDPYFLTTQFKIIESYSILTNVIDKLHLTEKLPEQLGLPPWTVDETFEYLSKKVSVEQTRMTSLIEITVKNPNPQIAANIANTIADSYKEIRLRLWREAHTAGSNTSRTNVVSQEDLLKAVQADLDALSLETRMLQVWAERKGVASADYLEYSNILITIGRIPRDKLGSELPTAYRNLTDTELTKKSEQLTISTEMLSAVEREYGVESPKYKLATQQLEHAQQDYQTKLDAIVDGIRNRVDADSRYLQIIEENLNKVKADQKDGTFRAFYKLKDALDKLEPPPGVFVIVRDPARPELKPVNGRPSIFLVSLLGGTLLALVVGGAAALFAVLKRGFSQPPSAPT